MFKTKSFNLVHEDDKRRKEVLYQPMRCNCIKLLLIPGLVGFCIMCILFNVDFSDNSPQTTRSPVTKPTKIPTLKPNNTTESATNGTKAEMSSEESRSYSPTSSEQFQRSLGVPLETNLEAPEVFQSRAAMACSNVDTCTIDCVGGSISEFSSIMVDKQKSCSSSLVVTLTGSTFPSQTLQASQFAGAYKIKSLTIDGSQITSIQDNAFKSSPITDLVILRLLNTKIGTLSKKTFANLNKIEEFKIVNRYPYMHAIHFLDPVGATLKRASIVEDSGVESDPGKWIGGGTSYTALELFDLNGNHFSDTLSVETFKNLVAVKTLLLRNCSIISVATKTFDRLVGTLEVLDLAMNLLTVLTGDFLLAISQNGLQIHLEGNPWKCSCDNAVLINELKKVPSQIGEEPKCSQPSNLKGVSLRCTTFACGFATDGTNICTTTTIPTTTTTTLPTTTTTAIPTTTTTAIPTTTTTAIPTTTTTTTTTIATTTSPTTTSDPGTSTESTIDSTTETTTETILTAPTSSTTIATTTSNTIPSTLPNDNGKESPPTEIPKNGIRITCSKAISDEYSILYVSNYDDLFTITSESSTSVNIIILKDLSTSSFIHFNKTILEGISNRAKRSVESPCIRSLDSTTKTISGLETKVSYVFCLILEKESRISPFNCQSHFLRVMEGSLEEPWMKRSNKPLFISMTVLGLVLFWLVGILGLYYLLRCYPFLMRGSKRLVPSGLKTKEMLLLPKDYKAQPDTNNGYGILENRNSTNTEMTSHSDYMIYYKPTKADQSNLQTIQTEEILAPRQPAPPIPLQTNDGNPYIITISSPQTKRILLPLQANENESVEYEHVGFYEEIY